MELSNVTFILLYFNCFFIFKTLFHFKATILHYFGENMTGTTYFANEVKYHVTNQYLPLARV